MWLLVWLQAGLVALAGEPGPGWAAECVDLGLQSGRAKNLLATATAVVLIPTVPRLRRGEGYLRGTLSSLHQAWTARPAGSPFERLHVVVYSGTSRRRQRHRVFEQLANEYSTRSHGKPAGPSIHFIDSSAIPCSVHRRVSAASTTNNHEWTSTRAACPVAAPRPRVPTALPAQKQAQTMDYVMLLSAAVHLGAGPRSAGNHTWPPLVLLEDDNEVCGDIFEKLAGVMQTMPRRPFGFVKISMGGNFLFDGGLHQPRMLWELTKFMLANIATFPADVAVHEYYRQQASLGAEAAAHYALQRRVAWHRGVDSTFGRAEWKDEKTAQDGARLATVNSCSSQRLELQQGGNFQRCSESAISSLVWCDVDSNHMQSGATPPAQQAFTSTMATTCASSHNNWKWLLSGAAVAGALALCNVVALQRSKCSTTSSILRTHARRSHRLMGLLTACFCFGVWLELQSDGIHSNTVVDTATHRDDFTGVVANHGGWWACDQNNSPNMERFVLQQYHFKGESNAKQQEPSTLPLSILSAGQNFLGQLDEWLVHKRDARLVDLTAQPPVAFSTFAEIAAVIPTNSTIRGSAHHSDHTKHSHRRYSALQLHGVGDLRLGSDQGYVHSLGEYNAGRSSNGAVQVRGSLVVTSTTECDGRWNFGVVLHDLQKEFMPQHNGTRAVPETSRLYGATNADEIFPQSNLHVRFHATHVADGRVVLTAMDTVESPLRRFVRYSLPPLGSNAQTFTSGTNAGTNSLAVSVVVEARPSDTSVLVQVTAADDGSSLASLRLCRAGFFDLGRVGPVSLRVEGDPACLLSEEGPATRRLDHDAQTAVVVNLGSFSATQVQHVDATRGHGL